MQNTQNSKSGKHNNKLCQLLKEIRVWLLSRAFIFSVLSICISFTHKKDFPHTHTLTDSNKAKRNTTMKKYTDKKNIKYSKRRTKTDARTKDGKQRLIMCVAPRITAKE